MVHSTEKPTGIRRDDVGTLKKLLCRVIKEECEQFVQVNENRIC